MTPTEPGTFERAELGVPFSNNTTSDPAFVRDKRFT
jgi:hypothetical protein